jgi:hypothetical protein
MIKPQPAPTLADHIAAAIDALETAKVGLQWYRDAHPEEVDGSDDEADAQIDASLSGLQSIAGPIPMVLHCPACGVQHIDAPENKGRWTNPPHRSHLCHYCGHVWRPADVATTGVLAIATKGKNDSPVLPKTTETGEIDYSLKAGDIVTSPRWSLTPLLVVDVNWALRAVALQLGPAGGIVVWPVRGLVKSC